jgi:ribosomal protein S15P/S13E
MPKKPQKKQEEGEKKQEKLSLEEYEKKVIELSEKELSAERIGEELRKQGIHPREYEKKISKILGKKYTDPELKNRETKLSKIEQHFKKNKQDKRAMRERSRIFSHLRKIKKYLKKE